MLLTTLPGRMNAAQWKKGENPEVGGREIRVLVTPTPDADAAHLTDSWFWCPKYIQIFQVHTTMDLILYF